MSDYVKIGEMFKLKIFDKTFLYDIVLYREYSVSVDSKIIYK